MTKRKNANDQMLAWMEGIRKMELSNKKPPMNDLVKRTKIINDINDERNRQDYLHPNNLNLQMRFITIMEEAGEVAEAMQNDDKDSIYRELIDTAASCVRMAEQVLQDE